MRPQIDELQRFYDGPTGRSVQRLLSARVRELWPDLGGRRLLAIGYPLPLFTQTAMAQAVVAMPETQGARPWPEQGPNRVVLVREDELPFPDAAFERLLLVHALENVRHPNRLLREAWRVLEDGGRMLVVVPNRHGLWCWSDSTPFGSGRPFSASQLDRLLANHLFAPLAEGQALWMPPLRSHLARRLAGPLERAGRRLAPGFAGVLLREAEKRIYAAPPVFAAVPTRRRRYVPLPEGAAAREENGRMAARRAAGRPS
ncbi:Ubiquinone/menaquinone biosynthesis C-methyltransferase UbiE [bacterium HR40]|nr:Ubiquinone/menaquinone biosynthesis C-methyltransferase UbiE [bacterium HR40]